MGQACPRWPLGHIGRAARATPDESRASSAPTRDLRPARGGRWHTYAADMLTRARARLAAWRTRFGPRVFDAAVVVGSVSLVILQLATDPAKNFPLGRI